jgi:hypothetical protein
MDGFTDEITNWENICEINKLSIMPPPPLKKLQKAREIFDDALVTRRRNQGRLYVPTDS